MKAFLIVLFLLISGFLLAQKDDVPVLLVKIEVNVEGAQFLIDGTPIFPENGLFEVLTGKHRLEIFKDGFQKIDEEIKVSRKNAAFYYQLIPNAGQVYEPVIENSQLETRTYFQVKSFPEAILIINGASCHVGSWIQFNTNVIDILLWQENYDSVVQQFQIATGDSLLVELYPKQKIHFDNYNFNMILVPGGSFLMKTASNSDEQQDTQVVIDSFFMAKFEVTQSLWETVMGNNPSKTVGENLPVENVTWTDVQAFIERLNKLSSRKFRLPTESEWDFAARGGNRTNDFKYSGSNNLDSVGWYWRNSGDTLLQGRFDNETLKKNNGRIHHVGTLYPNELGICDMSGNVWEWTNDWFSDDYYNSGRITNPQGPSVGETRVCRGGSFMSKPNQCETDYRFSYPPTTSYMYLGFRLAEDLQ